MKRLFLLLTVYAFFQPLQAFAQVRVLDPTPKPTAEPSAKAPTIINRPVVINMNLSSSRTDNTRFQTTQTLGNQPTSYSPIGWSPAYIPDGTVQTGVVPQPQPLDGNANPGGSDSSGVSTVKVVHHHPYTPGYIRKRLRKIGVSNVPLYITDRSQIIDTDYKHSILLFPEKGPGGQPLTETAVSPRNFNDPVVLKQMARFGDRQVVARINKSNLTETKWKRYYWHKGKDFIYCHYIDRYRYHWYGWYGGGQFFWTRYYANRWWWYDCQYGRWCFWNSGFWWWQDPNHVGDLYCYTNDAYVPCNSELDQVVVTSPDALNKKIYQSPDGGRIVAVSGNSNDAFLNDTANPPSFSPLYLASGVSDVQFSNPGNGRPMEILLKLNDGSFDVYDGDGNPFNPGEETAQDGPIPSKTFSNN